MFTFRRLRTGDFHLIIDMQQQIYESLHDKDTFQLSTAEFISYCLDGGGFIYSAHHADSIVGYRIIYLPRERDFNLSRDIPLPRPEQLKVAHFDTVAVLPQWRGFGLSRSLSDLALSGLASTDVRHLFATTSPRNPYSLIQLIAAGFRPVRLGVKFGGKTRILCYRPYPEMWLAADSDLDARLVPLTATEDLVAAFRAGWVGFGVMTGNTGYQLEMRYQPAPFDR